MAEASYAQHGVWITEQAGLAATAYHMALTVRFVGPLDLGALRAACDATIARHEVLRMATAATGDGLVLVPATSPPGLTITALHDELVNEEVTRPFDLAHGPLARFVLASGPAGEHVLVFVAHHLVFDGMSKDILLRELADGYAAAIAGRVWTPAPLRENFTRYVAGEREQVGRLLPAARTWWAAHWPDDSGFILPGLARPPVAAGPGGIVRMALPAAPLDQLAADVGATRFEVLVAAVHTLLARYGDPAPALAVDVSTRTSDMADHIGLFVNELPVGGPPGGTFRAAAIQVRAWLRDAYRFRAVPVGQAVNGLGPRAGLAPVGLSYRRRAATPDFPGLETVVDWQVGNRATRGALHLQFVDDGSDIGVALGYQHAVLDHDTAGRIGGHLRTLLDAATAEPDRPVVELPILPTNEAARIRAFGTGPVRTYPDRTVVDLFADQVRAGGDRPAVLGDGVVLSYRELDAEARRIADALRASGIGAGALVGVCLHRTPRLVATLLAIARVGAAYLPLEPGDPSLRRAMVLADARPDLVVTSASQVADLPAELSIVDLDRPWPAAEPEPTAASVRPDALAYVSYTSGSTGRPKGVMVSHRALANLLFALRDELGSGPDDRWLALTALSFDISALELFLPLITGGRVILAPDAAGRDGLAVEALVRDHGVTHLQATPSGWRVLLAAGFPDAPIVALTGGEALPAPLAGELRSRVRRLINVYGPTETTIWSTTADLTEPGAEVTIGAPLANTRSAVLDKGLRPVPLGIAGDLWLSGAGLADGYLGRPARTADSFRPEPGGPPGARGYRTGDRVVLGGDGRLRFLGRDDTQVKLRGHRIELGEVENRLAAHPGVAAAAVTLDDGERLVAYVAPTDRATPPSTRALRDLLAGYLPAVAIPTAWVFLDRLPLSPNGKLDRAALPTAGRDGGSSVLESASSDLPAPDHVESGAVDDELVERVRVIWESILQVDSIGLDEDLFELGGHSLTVTRISNRIHRQFGVALPLTVFYDTPTLGEVCAVIGRQLAATSPELIAGSTEP